MTRNVPAEVHQRYLTSPLGRAGRVEDVSHVVSALLSVKASLTTGAVINVNGGAYV